MTSFSSRLTVVISSLAFLAAVIVLGDLEICSAGDQSFDNTTYFDANDLLMFVGNTGSFAYDKTAYFGKNDGLYYPRGTNKTVLYAAGLWVGAKVGGEVRVSAAEYANDYAPGPMVAGASQPDQARFQVYKIRKGDTRESNSDYADWPFDDGAPSQKDHFGNDTLDSEGHRIPFVLGDEAMWAVFNDADTLQRLSDPGSAHPLGLEVQLYAFGYSRSGILGRTIFLYYTMINKGGNTLDSAYLSFWVDPDLGQASDDLIGCDTSRSVGFAYNNGPDALYGSSPPVVGLHLLMGPVVSSVADSAWVMRQGTWRSGYKNLRMTAFDYYINGTDPANATQTYNQMRGLGTDGSPKMNPVTATPTTFSVSGDPAGGAGWRDTLPSDKRMLITTGPFSMAIGDTQETVIAVVVGTPASHPDIEPHLAGILDLRDADSTLRAILTPAVVYSDVREVESDAVPTSVDLAQNYPNPFNTATEIRFSLDRQTRVSLIVYDALGRIVIQLVDEMLDAGVKSVVWDGRDGKGRAVSSGVYFYRLSAGDHTTSKKMVLLK